MRSQDTPSLVDGLQHLVLFFITAFLNSPEAVLPNHATRKFKMLPTPSCPRQARTSLRIAFAASLALQNIIKRRLLTKRDLYYICRPLFRHMSHVDSTLAALASQMRCTRNDLRMVAAPKGIVYGRVLFVDEDGCSVNVFMFGVDGCLIPPRPECMRNVIVHADAILV